MGNEEVRRMWVGGQIDEPTHTALLKMCTLEGKHPTAMVELAIEECIVNFARERLKEGKEIDDKILVTMLSLENRARENQVAQLKQLAYSHLRWSSEESAERLSSACEASGIAVEDLMEEINSNPHVKELVIENGQSLSSAELFLMENMSPGKLYPMKELISMGERSGFKEWTLKAAKGKLGIESRRESKMWVWVIPKRPLAGPDNDDEMVF